MICQIEVKITHTRIHIHIYFNSKISIWILYVNFGVEKCNNLNKGIKNRFELAERRIYKLEVRSIEIIQSEYEKEKWRKINEQNAQELWNTIKCTSTCMMGILEGMERKEQKNIERINNWKFAKFDENL